MHSFSHSGQPYLKWSERATGVTKHGHYFVLQIAFNFYINEMELVIPKAKAGGGALKH
jgi:hypothetical protein